MLVVVLRSFWSILARFLLLVGRGTCAEEVLVEATTAVGGLGLVLRRRDFILESIAERQASAAQAPDWALDACRL